MKLGVGKVDTSYQPDPRGTYQFDPKDAMTLN